MKQARQYGRRHAERKVGDNAKRTTWQRHLPDIAVYDPYRISLSEAPLQASYQLIVALDRNHAGAGAG